MTKMFDLREYGYDLYATTSPDTDAFEDGFTLVKLRKYSTGEYVFDVDILRRKGWSAVWVALKAAMHNGIILPEL